VQVYAEYARSHLYYSAELLLLLILLALINWQVGVARHMCPVPGGVARPEHRSWLWLLVLLLLPTTMHSHIPLTVAHTASHTAPGTPTPHEQDYPQVSWSTWLVAVSILWAPFWFNPQTFQLERTRDDFEAWQLWMDDVVDTETNSTWWVAG
jgi:hypothetical protein